MGQDEIVARIDDELHASNRKIVNRNALAALFGATTDPIGSLGKIFLGRKDAVELERSRIKQDIILELLCKMDDALSNANAQGSQKGVTIDGLIEAQAKGGDLLVGLDIGSNADNVRMQSGSGVSVKGDGTHTVIGVRIG